MFCSTKKKFSFTLLILLGLAALGDLSCITRARQNPFDPHGQIVLSLGVVSEGAMIKLNWDDPDLEGYSGFNLYRKQDGVDSVFKILAVNLLPNRRSYIDYVEIDQQQRYQYYLTVCSDDLESKPSNTVAIVPGPGNVWIVDLWGYQILHNTYDVEHVIDRILTNWAPSDMAIAKSAGKSLILYNDAGIVEAIDLSTRQTLTRITTIDHPYHVIYDAVLDNFWVIDSTGYLYRIAGETFQTTLVSSALGKPVRISISTQAGHINVVDQKLKKIIQFDREGDVIAEIGTIQGKPLIKPEQYAETADLQRFWLVDDTGEWDRIYTRSAQQEEYQCIDSINAAGDLALTPDDNLVWIVSYNTIDSAVLQLSATGTRQIELKAFYYPYDIEINPYDGTLLVADTGNGRILHYDSMARVMGTFLNINFPVKVVVE